MLYSRDYDISYYNPSMPVAEIMIGRGETEPTLSLTALIDSGADATIIPVHYLDKVRARKGESGWLRGASIQRTPIDLYVVSF